LIHFVTLLPPLVTQRITFPNSWTTLRPQSDPLVYLENNMTMQKWMRISAMALSMAVSTLASAHGTGDSAKEEINKVLARRVYDEGLSQGRFEVPYTATFVGRGGGTATFNHADGMREARGWREAFPDLKASVDFMVAEGDYVTVRWTARGTNTGAAMGIPATGKSVHTSGTAIFRFENGAIAEEWVAADSMGLMRQLGLLPARTPQTAATKQ
jgi:steroid delta-isomerase-like uncharacterized protein